jgi:hypothetical protein
MSEPTIEQIIQEVIDSGATVRLSNKPYTEVSEYEYQLYLKGNLPVADEGLTGLDALRSAYKNWKHLRTMRAQYV